MWYYVVALIVILFWFFLLRPRNGGKGTPPLVTTSTVVPVPIIGVISEFLKNPNEMMKRCYQDYGQVFTIPVCFIGLLLKMRLYPTIVIVIHPLTHLYFSPFPPSLLDLS